MSKRFYCDICDAPTSEGSPAREAGYLIGSPYDAPARSHPGFETRTCKIVVSATFAFQDRKDGYGGAPDLCSVCSAKLVLGVAKAILPAAAGAIDSTVALHPAFSPK